MLSKHLFRLLVVISFHWNLSKTNYLHTALLNTLSYPTDVDIIIVTDHKEALQALIASWGVDSRVKVKQASVPVPKDPQKWRDNVPLQEEQDLPPEQKYALLWQYHRVVEEAYHSDSHTAIMYMEDDTVVPWCSMVSWAQDTEVLEPLNFTRGIFRTEVRPDGKLVLMDFRERQNITDANRTVDVARINRSLYEQVSEKYQHSLCGLPKRKSCKVHRHYVQLKYPFQGMWIATRSQLAKFLTSKLWRYDVANDLVNHKDLFSSEESNKYARELGYPERSNGMFLFLDVPQGFISNNVVPYLRYDNHVQLSMYARVEHSRNGYSKNELFGLAAVLMKDALYV